MSGLFSLGVRSIQRRRTRIDTFKGGVCGDGHGGQWRRECQCRLELPVDGVSFCNICFLFVNLQQVFASGIAERLGTC
jgi:hypothetical protein